MILLLGRNNFESIPASITNLSMLSSLDLSYCAKLRSLPELPCQLLSIDAHNCVSLEASLSLPILFSRNSSQNLRVNFINCFKLVDQNAFEKIVEDALKKFEILARKKFTAPGRAFIFFTGNEIPQRFRFKRTGSAITFSMPRYLTAFKSFGLTVCAIVEFQTYHDNEGQGMLVGFDCILAGKYGTKSFQGTSGGWDFCSGRDYVDTDHVFLGYDRSFDQIVRLEDNFYI
ncbi:disease resistance protein RPP2B-like [Pistacia vera]|uniref:disease resistance protein RPP2B-like n=1 Tax=Pistacia vera TaxID=55513 RepID=UPI001263301D|nr:disease resistance protein RPP2B-like [Pistacia vera]